MDDTDLDAERERYVRMLVEAPVGAIGLTRGPLVESFTSPLEQQLEREARSAVTASKSGERREGGRAFLDKRKPDLVGARNA